MRKILAVLALVVAMTFVAQAPASAHNQWQCPHGQSCLFLNINGGGWIMPIVWSQHPHGEGQNACVDMVSFYRNDASSLVVDFGSGWDILLFETVGCTDYPDLFQSVQHKNFVWCNTCNSLLHLNDDVEAFKIVCRAC